MKQTILTTAVGPLANQPADRGRNVFAHDFKAVNPAYSHDIGDRQVNPDLRYRPNPRYGERGYVNAVEATCGRKGVRYRIGKIGKRFFSRGGNRNGFSYWGDGKKRRKLGQVQLRYSLATLAIALLIPARVFLLFSPLGPCSRRAFH